MKISDFHGIESEIRLHSTNRRFVSTFFIGANNVANSIGPILNTDSLTLRGSLLVGAIPMAIGALLFGGRVMGNVGSNIIRLNSYDALIISLIAGIIIFVASILGIPMPVAQIFTLSIVGVRYAKLEMSVPMSNKIIRLVAK